MIVTVQQLLTTGLALAVTAKICLDLRLHCQVMSSDTTKRVSPQKNKATWD